MKARPAPMVAPAPYNWTGFYLGFQSGGAIAETNWDFVPPGGVQSDHIGSGGLIGGTIGLNYQVGSWVWGIEGDYSYANIRGSINCPNNVFRCESELESFGTIRGRLGYAVGPMLFYATGGAAVGHLEMSTDNLAGVAVPPSGTRRNSVSDTQWGWTAGVGFEYAAMSSPLTWKIEWLYFDLGEERYGDLGAGDFADIHYRGNLIRTGLNYRFNWAPAPVVARY